MLKSVPVIIVSGKIALVPFVLVYLEFEAQAAFKCEFCISPIFVREMFCITLPLTGLSSPFQA